MYKCCTNQKECAVEIRKYKNDEGFKILVQTFLHILFIFSTQYLQVKCFQYLQVKEKNSGKKQQTSFKVILKVFDQLFDPQQTMFNS